MDEAAFVSAATQRWIEAAVDERVQRVLASTKSLSDWVATTCQQGAEASRMTAAALHESDEARRYLEADVCRLAEQLDERLSEQKREFRELQKLHGELQESNDRWTERFTSLELRLKSKEVTDQSRDEEFSSIVRDVQSIQLAVQRLESQWEKANAKFNKFGLEVASTSSAASIREGQCRSAQASLESRLESLSKSLSDLESRKHESLERLREEQRQMDALVRNHSQSKEDSEAKLRLEKDLKESCEKVFAAVQKRCNGLADQVFELSKSQAEFQEGQGHRQDLKEQRRSLENLQRRMQSMQVALETIAELRQEDHTLSEELKIEHEHFRQKLGDKLNRLETGLQESVRLKSKVEDIEVFLQNLQEDLQSSFQSNMNELLQEVEGLTKAATRNLRAELKEDFYKWVNSWERGFEHELPNLEKEVKRQLGYFQR